MAQNRDYLVQKITEHYNRNNANHNNRARKVGQDGGLTLEHFLRVVSVFDYKCPFCLRDFSEIPEKEWCFNHFESIKNTGNCAFSVVLSCQTDNSVLYKKFNDNVNDFLDSLGENRKEIFWDTLGEVAQLPTTELPELEPCVSIALENFCKSLLEKAANNV